MKCTNFEAWITAVKAWITAAIMTTLPVHTETNITLPSNLHTASISAHKTRRRDLDSMIRDQMTEKDALITTAIAEEVKTFRVGVEMVDATEVHTSSQEHPSAPFSIPTDLLPLSSWRA